MYDTPLYREEMMEIYKNPPHKGALENADVKTYRRNPMCGDEIDLQLKIQNNKIVDAKFDGAACAVSIISSARLLDEIIGKPLEDAKKLSKNQLLEIIDLNLTTSRVQCAVLALDALKSALEKYEQNK